MASGGSLSASQALAQPWLQVCLLKVRRRKHPGPSGLAATVWGGRLHHCPPSSSRMLQSRKFLFSVSSKHLSMFILNSAWLIPTDPVPRAVRGRQEAAKVRDGRRRRQEQETAAVERAKPGGLWAPRAVPERSSSPSTSQLLSPGINADPAMLTLSPAPSP